MELANIIKKIEDHFDGAATVVDETNDAGYEGIEVTVNSAKPVEDVHMQVCEFTPSEWWFSTSDRVDGKVVVSVGVCN